jgi:hypothetical protein
MRYKMRHLCNNEGMARNYLTAVNQNLPPPPPTHTKHYKKETNKSHPDRAALTNISFHIFVQLKQQYCLKTKHISYVCVLRIFFYQKNTAKRLQTISTTLLRREAYGWYIFMFDAVYPPALCSPLLILSLSVTEQGSTYCSLYWVLIQVYPAHQYSTVFLGQRA